MKKCLFAALFIVLMAAQVACAGTKLSRAAVDGDLDLVKERVEKKGENVNEIDKWGWTALMWAVYYGNYPVTQYLLEHGADPNIKTEAEYGRYLPGTTALILAAAYGHDDAVAALLKKKADSSVTDRNGKRAIDYAKEYQFDKCVALLKGK
ncbi:ankyrin repeat domain-containing protein [Geomonas sp. RF6]|uniref:ankyrin repeat domain-containing protein n=1 Tax=Geomonas sp. RF6 TaxID=2897342 RepID=UPI001E63541D|nr:ankyrin repeat domain-containing protein [Geomonas sp. RF6]UFS69352.1 ankyrin repeat domain-containing protein [Geomonas sp. RF6]